jgi:hypothetical protein
VVFLGFLRPRSSLRLMSIEIREFELLSCLMRLRRCHARVVRLWWFLSPSRVFVLVAGHGCGLLHVSEYTAGGSVERTCAN